jgi:hypothetical protein
MGWTKRHPAPHVETKPIASQPSAPSLSSSGTAFPNFVKSATAYFQLRALRSPERQVLLAHERARA